MRVEDWRNYSGGPIDARIGSGPDAGAPNGRFGGALQLLFPQNFLTTPPNPPGSTTLELKSAMRSLRAAYALLLIAPLLLSIPTSTLRAQREINIWYFGQKAGLDFNIPPGTLSSPAEVTTNALASTEGTALATDRNTGALLFYTNGIYIENYLHEKIPNSDTLNPGEISDIFYNSALSL